MHVTPFPVNPELQTHWLLLHLAFTSQICPLHTVLGVAEIHQLKSATMMKNHKKLTVLLIVDLYDALPVQVIPLPV